MSTAASVEHTAEHDGGRSQSPSRGVDASARRAGSRRSTLVGTWELVRLHLRLERVKLPVWVLSVVALVLVSATSVSSLYGSPEEIASYVSLVELSQNMASVNRALNGPGFGFDQPNVGVVLVNEVAIWGALAFALMAVFQMSRLTRGEEDADRTEVLRSRCVGRHAPLAAAAAVVFGSQMLAAVLTFAGLLAAGYAAVGSAALVAGYLAAGAVFGSVTALAAQAVSSARATVGVGVGAVGLAYLVRAVGDMGDGRLSWLSPIGWVHRIRPFAGEQWWVLGLSLALAVVLGSMTLVLADHRNLGSGLVQPRRGPAHAGAVTSRPVGLLVRLQAASWSAWAVGLFVLGVAYGAVAGDVEQMFAENPELSRFLPMGSSPTDSYLSYTLAMGVMLAAGAAIGSVLRLRGEERAGRLEFLLARPLSRRAWAGAHVAVAIVGAALVLAASGLATGISVAVTADQPGRVVQLTGSSLALLPLVVVLVGITLLLIGAAPRWSQLTWAALAVVVVVALFAELLRLPQWVRALSPLDHLAAMPAAAFDPVSFLAVAGVGAVLVAAGLVAFRRRDVPVT